MMLGTHICHYYCLQIFSNPGMAQWEAVNEFTDI